MKPKLIILGAGGHAKVIADAVLKSKQFEIAGFLDDSTAVGTKVMNGYCVLGCIADIEKMKSLTDFFVLGIGNIQIRKNIVQTWGERVRWATIFHPAVSIAEGVELGRGTVVLANAVVNWGAKIGSFSIVDSGVIVDHECRVGDFVHLSIGTCLGSNSCISAETKTIPGQVIQPFFNKDGDV